MEREMKGRGRGREGLEPKGEVGGNTTYAVTK